MSWAFFRLVHKGKAITAPFIEDKDLQDRLWKVSCGLGESKKHSDDRSETAWSRLSWQTRSFTPILAGLIESPPPVRELSHSGILTCEDLRRAEVL